MSEKAARNKRGARKGHKTSEETKKKISNSNKGRIVSDETRKKIAESVKSYQQSLRASGINQKDGKNKPHSWNQEQLDCIAKLVTTGHDFTSIFAHLVKEFPDADGITLARLKRQVTAMRYINVEMRKRVIGVRFNIPLTDIVDLYNDATIGINEIMDAYDMNLTNLFKSLAEAKEFGIPVNGRKKSKVRTRSKKSANPRGAVIDYRERPVKMGEEQKTIASVIEHGGFFGLTNVNVVQHWDMFKQLLRPKSPFFIAEREPEVYSIIKTKVEELQRDENQPMTKNIVTAQGDLFGELRRKYSNSTKSLFRYGHLDFCNTALTMIRDGNLLEDLKWLANSPILKDTFYMDITFVHRGDHATPPMFDTVLNHLIPSLFSSCGWIVSTFEDKTVEADSSEDFKFYKLYNENFKSTKMVRGFFKFERNY